jgi:hypothetical protein
MKSLHWGFLFVFYGQRMPEIDFSFTVELAHAPHE